MKLRAMAAGAVLCLCSSPLFAQGLGRVQLLALQQQLRDDACGVSHVTGHMDAMTRSAIRKCASKYNVSDPTAASELAAMNIGFGPNDPKPTLAIAKGGGMSSMGGSAGPVKPPPESNSGMGGSASSTLDSTKAMKDTMTKDTMSKDTMPPKDTTVKDSSMMSPTKPVPYTPATPPAMPMTPPTTPTAPPTTPTKPPAKPIPPSTPPSTQQA